MHVDLFGVCRPSWIRELKALTRSFEGNQYLSISWKQGQRGVSDYLLWIGSSSPPSALPRWEQGLLYRDMDVLHKCMRTYIPTYMQSIASVVCLCVSFFLLPVAFLPVGVVSPLFSSRAVHLSMSCISFSLECNKRKAINAHTYLPGYICIYMAMAIPYVCLWFLWICLSRCDLRREREK